MKRLRDDVYVGSQFKRPSSASRVESYGQAQISGVGGVGGGTAQKLTTNDALTYLKEVKDMFHDRREKYDQFLDVMKDFKAQRIHTDEVIEKVKGLFEGHDSLILGFNTFLPKGFEITITNVDVPPKKAVEFDEAIHFVNKIKKRFQNDDRVYKSFLDILNMYRKEHKDINEVYRDVAILFDDHPDLLNEFTRFLPDPSGTLSRQHIRFGPNFYKRCEEQRMSSFPPLRQAPTGKLWHRERMFTNESDHDLSVERPDLDDERTMMKAHKEHRKQNRDRRNYGEDIREAENEINGCKDLHMADKRKPARKVEDYGGYPNLNNCDDKNDLKSMYNQEFIFCEKVKERLCNTDDYQNFLKLLHIYSTEIINKDELKRLVADLLKKYPDLMDGFNEFLGRCENIDGFIVGVMNKKTLWNKAHVPRSVKGEEGNKVQRHEMESSKDKDRYNEKYMAKSIQELDLSDCERCTPSYRLFPYDYPIPSASQRSDVGAHVLNDVWVSVTSGSEDYSFKHMRRNQYEESLFRCEDDRFELDMLLESVTSTAKRAEELLNYLNDGEKNNLESPFHIEDHFTALNLRCVERLYGDHGLDVTDILRRNPALALPVILIRLKQKQEEWRRCRSDFNKVWADIYAKNHYKSLDHRSFYFKQHDSKSLCTKSLLGEIKDIKEKKQSEEDVLLAGSRQDLNADMEFVYSDMNIHDDLYKLVKYSCEEVCATKEHSNKVMQLWAVFVEPLLGVRSQPRDECLGASDAVNYKQLKSSKNVDDENSIDDSAMEDGLNKNNSSQKDPSSSSPVAWREERVKTFLTSDFSVLNLQAPISTIKETSRHGITNLEETFAPCPGIATIEDEHDPKQSTVAIGRPSSEGNGVLAEGVKFCKYNDSKIEKEEGELSPKADFEECDFAIYKDVKTTKCGVEKGKGFCGSEDERCENGGMDDEDEDESGNRSEAGENVSRSESVGGECSLEEEDAERNAFETNKVESDDDDDAHLLSEQRFLSTAKPLSRHLPVSVLKNREDSIVFYGNDNFYILLRLHQILYERILSAKTYSASAEIKKKALNLKETPPSSSPYARFMKALYSLLDGSSDNAKFEDDCRDIIGNQSYVLFTLDKLICKLVKQLQAVATDEVDGKLLQLYEYEKSRRPGKFVDSVYYENSRVILDDDNIYRFERLGPRLSIQLMENGIEKPEAAAVAIDPNFTPYLFNDFLSSDGEKTEAPHILLERNKSKYGGLDEESAACMAMQNVELINGLECKIACNSSKISYVLDTEDFFFRTSRRKRNASSSYDRKPKAERFHRFLSQKCNSV